MANVDWSAVNGFGAWLKAQNGQTAPQDDGSEFGWGNRATPGEAWEKVKRFGVDAAEAVRDYAVGAYQGGNEAIKQAETYNNMYDPSGENLLPGYTQEQADQQRGLRDKAQSDFNRETLAPTAMIAGTVLAPEVAIPAMIAYQGYEGYQNTQGDVGDKAYGGVRNATWGPTADMYQDPDLAKKAEQNPARTLTNAVLAVGQVAYPVAKALQGARLVKGQYTAGKNMLDTIADESGKFDLDGYNARRTQSADALTEALNKGYETQGAGSVQGPRAAADPVVVDGFGKWREAKGNQEQVSVSYDQQAPGSIVIDGVRYTSPNNPANWNAAEKIQRGISEESISGKEPQGRQIASQERVPINFEEQPGSIVIDGVKYTRPNSPSFGDVFAENPTTSAVVEGFGKWRQAKNEGALPQEGNADVIAIGEKQLGKPYDLASDGVNATDCGKFTQDVFAEAGVDLGTRLADGQYLNLERQGKTFTDAGQLQPGDLVFWDVPENRGRWKPSDDPAAVNHDNMAYQGITHVGIYAGDGKVLQAGGHGVGYMSLDKYPVVGYGRAGEGRVASSPRGYFEEEMPLGELSGQTEAAAARAEVMDKITRALREEEEFGTARKQPAAEEAIPEEVLEQQRQEAWDAGDLNAVADTLTGSPLVANALRRRAAIAESNKDILAEGRSPVEDGRFFSGQETTIPYYKNLERAPDLRRQGDPFAQSIEPKGEYIGYDSLAGRRSEANYRLPNHEFGTITFKKPLVVDYTSTGHGGWKTTLSEQYGGKTGSRLSNAIVKDGYDGILTVNKKTGEVHEVINLRGVKNQNKEYMAANTGLSVPTNSPRPETPSGIQAPDTVSRRQIVDKVNELFTKVSTGRLGVRGVLGWFDRGSEVIRTKDYADFRAVMHEIGHYLDKGLNLRNEAAFDGELIGAVDRRFGNAYDHLSLEQKRGEGIAEFIHDYTTNPARAQQEFPGYYRAFEQRLGQEPQIRNKIAGVSKMLNTWYNQAAGERVKGSISFGDSRSAMQKIIDGVKNPRDTAAAVVGKGRTAAETAYDNLIDQLAPLDRMMKQIKGVTGEDIPLIGDVYKRAWLTRGWAGKAETLIKHGMPDQGIPALESIVKSVQGDMEGFSAYVVALREMDAYNIADATGVKYRHALSKADAARTIAEGQLKPEFVRAQQDLVKYQNHLLDVLVDAGIKDRASVEAMKAKWPNYAPFFREFDEAAIQKFISSRGFGNVSDPVKSFKGSTRDIINPLESIIKNTYQFINLAERNKVGRLFVDLAQKPGIGTIIEKVSGSATSRDSTFSIWNNGRKESYNTTPELYRAIMLLDREPAQGIAKILSIPAGWLRAGAVLSPEFIVRNPVRDAWSAFISTKYGFIPGVDTMRGLVHLLKKDNLYWEYQNSGAAHSSMVSLDRDYLAESVRQMKFKTATQKAASVINPKTYIDILRTFSEATEMATRLAEYENARIGYSGVLNRLFSDRRTPKSVEEAALGGRDVTLDFSRSGVWGKEINKFVAFWNAAVQGADKMIRAFKENPVGVSTRTFMSITLPSIVLYYMNRDDPRYQELPQWQKDLFWIIPTKDTLIKIPKPFELGILFGTSAERMLQWIDNKEKGDPNALGKAFKGFGKTTLDAMLPGWIPTAMLPILEWTTNYSFFMDRDIVPKSQEKLPPKLQYGSNTSAVGKAIGNAFNVSPSKVDNTIRGYTGGLGGLAMTASDVVAGEFDKRPTMRVSEYPGVRAFTATPYKSSQSVQDLYDRLAEQEQLYSEKKSTGITPQGFSASELKDLRKAADNISEIHKKQKAVLADPKLSSEEKRSRLDKLNIMAVNYARKGLGNNNMVY